MAGAANGSLGVAVARFGDDASVIFPRQGLVASPPIKVRHIDGTQGAGLVARKWQDWQADACFIDKGGFGSSWIDNLRRLGREPVGIAFSGRAADPRYDNRRTKMYFEAVDWIRKGGALPPGEASRELIAALSRTTYSFCGDRLLLEPKDQVKARLGYSPDDADAFVQPMAARGPGIGRWGGGNAAALRPGERLRRMIRWKGGNPVTRY